MTQLDATFTSAVLLMVVYPLVGIPRGLPQPPIFAAPALPQRHDDPDFKGPLFALTHGRALTQSKGLEGRCSLASHNSATSILLPLGVRVMLGFAFAIATRAPPRFFQCS